MARVITRSGGFEVGVFVILQKNWGTHNVCDLVRKIDGWMVTRIRQEKKNLVTELSANPVYCSHAALI